MRTGWWARSRQGASQQQEDVAGSAESHAPLLAAAPGKMPGRGTDPQAAGDHGLLGSGPPASSSREVLGGAVGRTCCAAGGGGAGGSARLTGAGDSAGRGGATWRCSSGCESSPSSSRLPSLAGNSGFARRTLAGVGGIWLCTTAWWPWAGPQPRNMRRLYRPRCFPASAPAGRVCPQPCQWTRAGRSPGPHTPVTGTQRPAGVWGCSCIREALTWGSSC